MHISKLRIHGDLFMVIQEATYYLQDDDLLFRDVRFLIVVFNCREADHIFAQANSYID